MAHSGEWSYVRHQGVVSVYIRRPAVNDAGSSFHGFLPSEWVRALDAVPGLRPPAGLLAQSLAANRLPDHDVEVLVNGTWQPMLHYRAGDIFFQRPSNFRQPLDPVWRVANALAQELGCLIYDDEGYYYIADGSVIKD